MSEPGREGTPIRQDGNLAGYETVLTQVVELVEVAHRASARAVNAVMTATYWEIGRRIVQYEQGGEDRAAYGTRLIEQLSGDLKKRYGRGFGVVNLHQMRKFYLAWPGSRILQTVSEESEQAAELQTSIPTTAGDSPRPLRAPEFPLPWSHYVKLMTVSNVQARAFYEAEALRGGWTVRQLHRQIDTQFYERTALSRDRAAMLAGGAMRRAEDTVTPEEEIKDPFVLEFLRLKDEYSEDDLEEALIRHLESFLLELGGDFAFLSRQRRLRIGDEWYRIDLLFFHRRLRCLVVIDLKVGRLTHADAGQMHLYLNYAREHWTHHHENPPVGLILCAQKDAALAHYALEGLPNKVLAAEYRMTLPDERTLAAELDRTRRTLEEQTLARHEKPEE